MASSRQILIYGFGALGAAVAHASLRSRRAEEVMVVDQDDARLRVASRGGYRTVLGNATHAEVQLAAGIASARDVVICMAEKDALQALRVARSLSSRVDIRVAASTVEAEKLLLAAGADYVLLVPSLTGEMLAAAAVG